VWLLVKTYAMVFMVIWVRWALPRLRVDQLMGFGWKILIPSAILNVFLTALGIVTNVFVLVALQVVMVAGFIWLISRIGSRAGAVERAGSPEVTP
jgi:hypothetical protein